MAGSGEYNKHYPKSGFYECAGCAQPLYDYASKFDSGCVQPHSSLFPLLSVE